MTLIVADASVVMKWLLRSSDDQADSDRALSLWSRVGNGTFDLLQPPHWLAEVAAVLVQLSPATACDDVASLYAMQLPVLDTPEVYLRACELAGALRQHVFDTLYHAVALLTPDATLVTADERYYRKAAAYGSIELLARFGPAEEVED